jgi:adenine-specific DNA-methyltransferase
MHDKTAIILDFFSGSATTAEAVIKLNSEDNGSRKFILVQLPEKCLENSNAYKKGYRNICEIGEERIRRSAKKIKEETGADIDYGFRVYKVDSSNMKDVFYKPNEIRQENLFDYMTNIKEDRTSEDLLTQVILDLGLTLDLKIEEKQINNNKVYYVSDNALVACFDDQIDIEIVDKICECKPLKVVFKDISFKTDKDKINLEERIKKNSPETEINIL